MKCQNILLIDIKEESQVSGINQILVGPQKKTPPNEGKTCVYRYKKDKEPQIGPENTSSQHAVVKRLNLQKKKVPSVGIEKPQATFTGKLIRL